MDSKFVALAVWSAIGVLTYGTVSQVLSPNRAEESIDNARRLGWKQRFDIVFIGDSRTHNCAAPSAMRQALPGLRMANYGWSSLGWGGEVLASAKATLDPSGKRVVVIGASPIAFTRRSATQNAFLDTARSAWLDRWTVPRAPAATNFFSVYGPNQWLRSLNPELGSVPFRIHEDGWYEATTKPLNGARIVRMYADRLRASPFDMELLALLCEEVGKMRAQGITVIAFRPPSSEQMRMVEEREGAYREELVREQLESAGALYLEVPGTYTTYDGSHLNSEEAQRFSRELGMILATAIPKKSP